MYYNNIKDKPPWEMKMKEQLLDTLVSKYESDYKQAHATLEIYLTNPVGIGEHPQHLEEMDKLVEAMAGAMDKLDTLKKQYIDIIKYG
jgi:DNA repair exonuclease SbcCD ATPase subunit